MSSFLFRRPDDTDLRSRLDQLENAHRALAREHEGLEARTEESITLLTLLGVEKWLRDAIERAKASGWIVACSPQAIVFMRPEGEEHSYSVPIPLPDEAVERTRRELRARVLCFERQTT